jgi:hypothetical protein
VIQTRQFLPLCANTVFGEVFCEKQIFNLKSSYHEPENLDTPYVSSLKAEALLHTK